MNHTTDEINREFFHGLNPPVLLDGFDSNIKVTGWYQNPITHDYIIEAVNYSTGEKVYLPVPESEAFSGSFDMRVLRAYQNGRAIRKSIEDYFHAPKGCRKWSPCKYI